MTASITKIFIANSAEKSMKSLENAQLVAGKGIEGDRYFNGSGTFSEKLKGNPAAELTLIEKEEINYFNNSQQQQMRDEDFRRNIITQGIRLNDLVGKTFTVGDVTLKGIRLCEPCAHLANTVNELFMPHMIGRGGLRAQILSSGKIKTGDKIQL